MNHRVWCLAAVLGAMALGPTGGRAEVLDRVAATIDEEAIFQSDVQRRARPFLTEMEQTVPPAARPAQRAEILRQTLERMIDDNLLRRAATRAHQAVNDSDVDEWVQRIASERGGTPEQVYEAIAATGISRAEYREFLEAEILRVRMLQLRVRGRINITDTELRQEYQAAGRAQSGTVVTRPAHIFVAVPEDAPADRVAELRARAEELARRAQAGEDFAELARQNSDDTATREHGGDLGAVDEETLPVSLREAMQRLPVGGTSGVLEGPAGLHVLRVLSRQAPELPPFEQVRQALYQRVLAREMQRHQRIYSRELRRGVVIDVR